MGAGGAAVGVDVGEGVLRSARERWPEARFESADAWDTAALLRALGGRHADVVLLDIGGVSGAGPERR